MIDWSQRTTPAKLEAEATLRETRVAILDLVAEGKPIPAELSARRAAAKAVLGRE